MWKFKKAILITSYDSHWLYLFDVSCFYQINPKTPQLYPWGLRKVLEFLLYQTKQQQDNIKKKKNTMKFQPRFWCKTNFSYKKKWRKKSNIKKNIRKNIRNKKKNITNQINWIVCRHFNTIALLCLLLCYAIVCFVLMMILEFILKKRALCLVNISKQNNR